MGLRKLCLGFPGAIEDFPFGPETSVFKVEGKLFALSALAVVAAEGVAEVRAGAGGAAAGFVP